MVALVYISRNELFGWVLNIQSNNRITNFPASVPKFLLDGNYISAKHWPIYEDLDNPIQISCIREYPGDDMINWVQHELSPDLTKNVSYEIMTNIL